MASAKQTALAAMTCTSGPPCMPGKTLLSMAAPYFSLARMMPERGPAQRLVRRGGDDVGVLAGVRVQARRHQAGEVRHVHQEDGAHRIGDLAEAAEVDDARVGAAAGDDHLRAGARRPAGPVRRSR